MGSHQNMDHQSERRRSFLERLTQRAEDCRSRQESTIVGGRDGEKPLLAWNVGGMQGQVMPPDEQGINRISIGGGSDLPIQVDYCVIRGDVGQCIKLLDHAIQLLRRCPE